MNSGPLFSLVNLHLQLLAPSAPQQTSDLGPRLKHGWYASSVSHDNAVVVSWENITWVHSSEHTGEVSCRDQRTVTFSMPTSKLA